MSKSYLVQTHCATGGGYEFSEWINGVYHDLFLAQEKAKEMAAHHLRWADEYSNYTVTVEEWQGAEKNEVVSYKCDVLGRYGPSDDISHLFTYIHTFFPGLRHGAFGDWSIHRVGHQLVQVQINENGEEKITHTFPSAIRALDEDLKLKGKQKLCRWCMNRFEDLNKDGCKDCYEVHNGIEDDEC